MQVGEVAAGQKLLKFPTIHNYDKLYQCVCDNVKTSQKLYMLT